MTPEAMSKHSGLSYITCKYLLTAARMNNLTRLAILAEKHLLTGPENEELKNRGLTVLDTLEGKFDYSYDYGTIDQLFNTWNDRLGESVFVIK